MELLGNMKIAPSESKNYRGSTEKRIFMMSVAFGRPHFDFDGSWLPVDFWPQNGRAA